MKILVTGGAGFVGKVVCRKLKELGHDVTVLDVFLYEAHGAVEWDVRKYTAENIRRIRLWSYDPSKFDVVIHLAAKVGVGQSMYQLYEYVSCNSSETARFLSLLLPVKPARLVVASSMSIYGEGAYTSVDGRLVMGGRRTKEQLERRQWELGEGCYRSIPTPESKPPDLTSIYALTKFDQEQLCTIWGNAYDVPTVALRFFNIYGPGQALQNPYTGAMAIFATRILNGKPPVIYEDGQQTRDFIHVEDVADAVVMAALGDVPRGTYNVGTGIPRTIESVARGIGEALGTCVYPEITGKYRVGDIRHCYANIEKLKECGWSPKVKFEDGLRSYAEWLRTQILPNDRFSEAAQELINNGLVK